VNAQTVGIQTTLGIDFAPEQMRRFGLREAHTYPLVSTGKIANGEYISVRVPASEAWAYPEVEQRTPTSWPLLVLDLDGRSAFDRLNLAMLSGSVLPPSWYVSRRTTGGIHAFWAMRRPVLRGPQARRRPLAAFQRVSEWYALQLEADGGFAGVLSHNAVYEGGEFATDWLSPDAFTLSGLSRPIPKGWRRPARAELRSAVGRNCSLFDAAMRWAGSSRRRGMAVLPVLEALNREFAEPLPASEVASIARSVERYRARWVESGRFYSHTSAEQAQRGRRSGQARRRATAERDAAIVEAVEGGQSQAAVGRAFGLSRWAVRKIVRRDGFEPVQLPLADGVVTEPTQLMSRIRDGSRDGGMEVVGGRRVNVRHEIEARPLSRAEAAALFNRPKRPRIDPLLESAMQ